MKPSKGAVTGLFLAAAGLLVGTVLFTWFVGRYAVQANSAVTHERRVIRRLDRISTTLDEAEAGQRGYLLFGQDSYLQPYHEALRQLDNQQAALRSLAAAGDISSADLQPLERLIQEKLAELEQSIQLRRTNLQAALQVVATGRGRVIMDHIRTTLAGMTAQEEKELALVFERSRRATTARTLAFAFTALVNLGFLAWAYRRIAREMARRQAAVMEVTRQKELLGTTLASIGDGIVVTDAEGCVTFLNAEAERLTGWKDFEAHGRPLSQVFRIIDETARQPAESPIEKALRLGSSISRTDRTLLLAKDGRAILIDASAAPIRLPNGPLFGAVLVFHDMTERRLAEAALRASEERHRVLAETMLQGVVHQDADGKIIAMNPAAERILGKGPAEFLGSSSIQEEPYTIREDGSPFPGHEHPSMVALRTGQPSKDVVMGVFNPRLAAYCWISIDAVPLFRPNETRPFQVYTVFADITGRKQAEAALRDAQAQLKAHAANLELAVQERTARLQEMVAELQHVSYAIMHDMRAPLRAMGGFATALTTDLESPAGLQPDQARTYCDRILNGASRLDKLITGALTYTKAALQQLPMEPVDLSRLLRGILDTYPDLQPDKADICIQGELPAVIGSESLLTQCFSNLLGNAVKFVAPGVRPRIRIWAEFVQSPESPAARSEIESRKSEIKTGLVRIWVEDNGIGISKRALSRLFGLFQKLDSEYEGTGIGLAIVRKVVQRMGGRVGVESEPGQGSRFWVELPSVPHAVDNHG